MGDARLSRVYRTVLAFALVILVNNAVRFSTYSKGVSSLIPHFPLQPTVVVTVSITPTLANWREDLAHLRASTIGIDLSQSNDVIIGIVNVVFHTRMMFWIGRQGITLRL